MKRYLYILLLLPLMVSCERAIPYNGEYQDPKLVVQACVGAGDDAVVCYVNRSYFFLDTKPRRPEPLEGVTVALQTSSGAVQVVKDSVADNLHYLLLNRPVAPGETVQLSASHSEFGTATAQETLLPAFVPTVEKCVIDTAQRQCYLTLCLPEYDYPQTLVYINARQYYTHTLIRAIYNKEDMTFLRWDTVVNLLTQPSLYSRDNIFALESNETLQGYYVASLSKTRPGLQLRANYTPGRKIDFFRNVAHLGTVTAPNGSSYTYRLDSIVVSFELHGETYQMYKKSMQDYLGVGDEETNDFDLGAEVYGMMGMEERVAVYGNVDNGFGILTSKTKNSIVITDYTIQ